MRRRQQQRRQRRRRHNSRTRLGRLQRRAGDTAKENKSCRRICSPRVKRVSKRAGRCGGNCESGTTDVPRDHRRAGSPLRLIVGKVEEGSEGRERTAVFDMMSLSGDAATAGTGAWRETLPSADLPGFGTYQIS